MQLVPSTVSNWQEASLGFCFNAKQKNRGSWFLSIQCTFRYTEKKSNSWFAYYKHFLSVEEGPDRDKQIKPRKWDYSWDISGRHQRDTSGLCCRESHLAGPGSSPEGSKRTQVTTRQCWSGPQRRHENQLLVCWSGGEHDRHHHDWPGGGTVILGLANTIQSTLCH